MALIGLYDVDSTIPNLAIMKLSAFHKRRGDTVSMYLPVLHDQFDTVYASKIFSFSSGQYMRPDMVVGGTGIDVGGTLPQAVEDETPDYSIYDYPHSIGFTMRGCRLKCSFCVVPQKEGAPKSSNTVGEIWTQRASNFIMLLDNDFFGNPQWRQRIEELRDFDLKVNFSQGLNIRNITSEQVDALASVKFRNAHNTARQVYFAWDNPRDKKSIMRGFQRCLDGGIAAHEMGFFVLIGYGSTLDEDLRRVETLRDIGADPFVMPYNKSDPAQKSFARWVNHKAVFNSISWTEYCRPRPRSAEGYGMPLLEITR